MNGSPFVSQLSAEEGPMGVTDQEWQGDALTGLEDAVGALGELAEQNPRLRELCLAAIEKIDAIGEDIRQWRQ